jgi:hypothetical protein
MVTGSDQERHLAGCSALLRASQGREVDPSTPGLRQAAFWVYMRQCLYNACVHQQAPNVDLENLVLIPPPDGGDPLSDLRSETAWANTMTWICATVVHFCFGSSYPEHSTRIRRWQQLSEAVESWLSTRPDTFNPIWYSEAVQGSGNPFPEIWFTADWHIMAFGFYHLARMLLAIYKPSHRFAVRGLHSTARESDIRVMMHARAICGACNSSPSTVPSLITLCHSTFIWGPLMTDPAERAGVIRLLRDMEATHAWPTTWIINSLKEEWAMT